MSKNLCWLCNGSGEASYLGLDDKPKLEQCHYCSGTGFKREPMTFEDIKKRLVIAQESLNAAIAAMDKEFGK